MRCTELEPTGLETGVNKILDAKMQQLRSEWLQEKDCVLAMLEQLMSTRHEEPTGGS